MADRTDTGLTAAAPSGAHSHGGPGQPMKIGHTIRRYSRNPADFPTPTGREEDWRFTPLDRLGPLLEPLAEPGKLTVEVAAAPEVSVRTVAGDDPLVGSVLTPSDRPAALAMAGISEALVVEVPAEARPATPTYLTVRGEGVAGYGHLVVDVGRFAEAVVVLDHVGSAVVSANVEIRVGDGASLTLVSLQDWEDDAVHVATQAALVGRDARLRHVAVTLGGGLVRIRPTVSYAGPGGDVELLGLFFTDSGQHQEHRTFVDHNAPHCRSRVTYKGALQGEGAHAVWIGDVAIRPAAIGIDTYELNRNLVLTDGARADSVPNLEIETGEIAGAGHASATGRFDDLQLFYLMSRGISADDARRLVVRGFFAEVIDRIGVPEISERLRTAIEEELEQVNA
jgi:Fe-S cluster assembly protein SufD